MSIKYYSYISKKYFKKMACVDSRNGSESCSVDRDVTTKLAVINNQM